MRFISGFLIGAGIGAALVNLTLVPHGYNQGFFAGAASVFLGGIVLAVDQRKRSKDR